MQIAPEFEMAIKKEYGQWPFAYGVDSRSKGAMESFSRIFAHGTSASFLRDDFNEKADLESMYKSIVELAGASKREDALKIRLQALIEDGADKQDLEREKLRAAMTHQIEGGFRDDDDWPSWMKKQFGIFVPEMSSPKHEKTMPCAVGWNSEAGSASSSEQSDSEYDGDDVTGGDPEEFHQVQIKHLLKDVPSVFAKLKTKTLRQMHSIVHSRWFSSADNHERAVRLCQGLLPHALQSEWNKLFESHPVYFTKHKHSHILSQITIACLYLLGHRTSKSSTRKPNGAAATRAFNCRLAFLRDAHGLFEEGFFKRSDIAAQTQEHGPRVVTFADAIPHIEFIFGD